MRYLTNYASSEYGNDKSSVANKMAENGATLLLLNGSDDGKTLGLILKVNRYIKMRYKLKVMNGI